MEGALTPTFSDDTTGSKDDDTKSFLEFCPDWQNTDLWRKWSEYNREILQTGWMTPHIPVQLPDGLSS